MKNIFAQTKDYVKQPKRNVFDMSFQNNGTYNFGTLYPVFCKEVIPGDSVSIDTTFALRFLPLAFPIQTSMKANIHFFYVRNRNLWDNWKKFITHTDNDVVFPTLSGNQSCLTTGGLADYLGVPSTLVGQNSAPRYLGGDSFLDTNPDSISYSSARAMFYVAANSSSYIQPPALLNSSDIKDYLLTKNSVSPRASHVISTAKSLLSGLSTLPESLTFYTTSNPDNTDIDNLILGGYLFISYRSGNKSIPICYHSIEATPVLNDNYNFVVELPVGVWYLPNDTNPLATTQRTFQTYDELRDYILSQSNGLPLDITIESPSIDNTPWVFDFINYDNINQGNQLIEVSYSSSTDTSALDISDLSSNNNPFINGNPNHVGLSALPFRAYESIYNAFYRNEQNDPLMIDGKPSYDVYVPNTSDGVDDYEYKLYNRNWELDFLTSAVQSPQQGIAPLVGVSSSGDFTFVNKDDNGNIGYFTAKANISDDGSSITGFELSDKVVLDGVPSTPDVSDVPDGVKRGTVYSLNQMALAGISINDFRNVNALQRWLETNIRRGYKYRDQIKSHFGVDVTYQELDMPEFIGGISEPVYINQVNQTTETESDPLGSYAGQASVVASSNHTIRHYCDEHGFIIGILSVVPVPNYSQLLPKHFIKNNYLDYFFPEFGHIGMQPIDYREVCPLQAYIVNPSGINNTFGYQRAWYDYIASVDEVHGLFRSNLRNFVLNRQFDSIPRLNQEFLQVDAEQLNDVFTVQDVSDKILGQIKFNCIFKRAIPRFGIPRLE